MRPAVEGGLEVAGVAVVLREGGSELVGAAEIRIGAEEEVVVRIGIEHGVQAGLGRYGDGAGRKAGILVGIVR